MKAMAILLSCLATWPIGAAADPAEGGASVFLAGMRAERPEPGAFVLVRLPKRSAEVPWKPGMTLAATVVPLCAQSEVMPAQAIIVRDGVHRAYNLQKLTLQPKTDPLLEANDQVLFSAYGYPLR